MFLRMEDKFLLFYYFVLFVIIICFTIGQYYYDSLQAKLENRHTTELLLELKTRNISYNEMKDFLSANPKIREASTQLNDGWSFTLEK